MAEVAVGVAPLHRMAKAIRVEQDAGSAPLVYIDGELFPFYTAKDPKIIKLGRGQLPTIVLEVVAETLDVHATITLDGATDG